MVVLNKIYTKTGDKGTTALGTGERRQKDNLRVETYGTVDETNASLGVVRITTQHRDDAALKLIDTYLLHIQNDLFDVGADLCTPESDEPLDYEPLRITEGQVEALETAIDILNKDLEPLRSFVLPGGADAAAHLHVSRTLARRAERLSVALAREEKINPQIIIYLNRLSDFLFVASRYANAHDQGDVLWVPGKNR